MLCWMWRLQGRQLHGLYWLMCRQEALRLDWLLFALQISFLVMHAPQGG